ncbi:MAG: radical SAM family heme chaperone HemW [Bacteroidales bacterium]|nr:radical SAM family heme chaperone HemW [Bacteroidales bacterium]
MAGIYIHIPFCKQKCFYCDFYSTTLLKNKPVFVKALNKEFYLQKDYLKNNCVETIYFGGGTPSVLTYDELMSIFNQIYNNFDVVDNPEITFEANPDDLTNDYLKELKHSPVNRLSIGVQSFFDDDLKTMNRRHNAAEAEAAVKLSQDVGFHNISLDLIYGLPKMNNQKWLHNLNTAFNLNIQHLSAYHLTYEPKTVFYNYLKNKIIIPVVEQESIDEYRTLVNKTKQEGFIHYEISNFGKKGFFSKHNSNYWRQEKYLGVGPSAHSFNNTSRQWNVKDTDKYISFIEKEILPYDSEILDPEKQYNDYIITSLRTMWGVDLDFLKEKFNERVVSYCLKSAEQYIKTKNMNLTDNHLILSEKGMLIADKIISDLFIIDEEVF